MEWGILSRAVSWLVRQTWRRWQHRLRAEEKDLLRAMATGRQRALIVKSSSDPMYIHAGSRVFRDLDDPTVTMRYAEALTTMEAKGLVELVTPPDVFRPTVKGLMIGRKLADRASARN